MRPKDAKRLSLHSPAHTGGLTVLDGMTTPVDGEPGSADCLEPCGNNWEAAWIDIGGEG